jgi:hypothetical protein
MPYTGEAKNAMLAALATGSPKAGWVGLFVAEPALTGWTGTGSILTRAGHGLVDKDLVVLNTVTGGAGLVAERLYYVHKVSTSEIELFAVYALTAPAEAFTTNVTEASISKLVEASGGSPAYKRVAAAFGAAAKGVVEDKTERELNCASGQAVDYIGYFSAETGAGTCLSVAKVTHESFASQGLYKVREGSLDLMPPTTA